MFWPYSGTLSIWHFRQQGTKGYNNICSHTVKNTTDKEYNRQEAQFDKNNK